MPAPPKEAKGANMKLSAAGGGGMGSEAVWFAAGCAAGCTTPSVSAPDMDECVERSVGERERCVKGSCAGEVARKLEGEREREE